MGKNIDKIRNQVEKTATSQHISGQHFISSQPKEAGHKYVSGELKSNTLKRSLDDLQEELRFYQRPFSRLIHNDVIDQISDLGAKTIARPEGLFTGGLVMFFASLLTLLICRYYGYPYDYFIGIVSFPVGYILGVLAKLLIKSFIDK